MSLQRIISNISLKCLRVILFFFKNILCYPSFPLQCSYCTANLYKCHFTFSVYTHHDQSEHETTGLSFWLKEPITCSWSKYGCSNQPFWVLYQVLILFYFKQMTISDIIQALQAFDQSAHITKLPSKTQFLQNKNKLNVFQMKKNHIVLVMTQISFALLIYSKVRQYKAHIKRLWNVTYA